MNTVKYIDYQRLQLDNVDAQNMVLHIFVVMLTQACQYFFMYFKSYVYMYLFVNLFTQSELIYLDSLVKLGIPFRFSIK